MNLRHSTVQVLDGQDVASSKMAKEETQFLVKTTSIKMWHLSYGPGVELDGSGVWWEQTAKQKKKNIVPVPFSCDQANRRWGVTALLFLINDLQKGRKGGQSFQQQGAVQRPKAPVQKPAAKEDRKPEFQQKHFQERFPAQVLNSRGRETSVCVCV